LSADIALMIAYRACSSKPREPCATVRMTGVCKDTVLNLSYVEAFEGAFGMNVDSALRRL